MTVKARGTHPPGMALALPGGADHPSWLTAVGTLVSYGLVLVGLFVLLFLVPYALFVGL